MSTAEFLASARRHLAAEYEHHRRMMAVCASTGGMAYHRNLKADARRRFLTMMKESRV